MYKITEGYSKWLEVHSGEWAQHTRRLLEGEQVVIVEMFDTEHAYVRPVDDIRMGAYVPTKFLEEVK